MTLHAGDAIIAAMRTLLAMVLGVLFLGACSKNDSSTKSQATPSVAVQGRRIDVLAKFDRYEPDVIPVKAGEQVTLVFKRVTTNECLAELDIPSQQVKKPLPVNELVAIPFKADKPGDVEFLCGMQMVRGKLKVE